MALSRLASGTVQRDARGEPGIFAPSGPDRFRVVHQLRHRHRYIRDRPEPVVPDQEPGPGQWERRQSADPGRSGGDAVPDRRVHPVGAGDRADGQDEPLGGGVGSITFSAHRAHMGTPNRVRPEGAGQ